MSDEYVVGNALLLLVGGNETTRNVISGGIDALIRNPDQMERTLADLDDITGTVEECLRWVTPDRDDEPGHHPGRRDARRHDPQGSQVLMAYISANRDEDVFDDPFRFDVTRSPNPHIAFGWGPHLCLGAALARLEVRTILTELLTRVTDLRLADPDQVPVYSHFVVRPWHALAPGDVPARLTTDPRPIRAPVVRRCDGNSATNAEPAVLGDRRGDADPQVGGAASTRAGTCATVAATSRPPSVSSTAGRRHTTSSASPSPPATATDSRIRAMAVGSTASAPPRDPPEPNRTSRSTTRGLSVPLTPHRHTTGAHGLGIMWMPSTTEPSITRVARCSGPQRPAQRQVSSSRRPRVSYDSPAARYSSRCHPTPTPRSNRPADSTSRVAHGLRQDHGATERREEDVGPDADPVVCDRRSPTTSSVVPASDHRVRSAACHRRSLPARDARTPRGPRRRRRGRTPPERSTPTRSSISARASIGSQPTRVGGGEGRQARRQLDLAGHRASPSSCRSIRSIVTCRRAIRHSPSGPAGTRPRTGSSSRRRGSRRPGASRGGPRTGPRRRRRRARPPGRSRRGLGDRWTRTAGERSGHREVPVTVPLRRGLSPSPGRTTTRSASGWNTARKRSTSPSSAAAAYSCARRRRMRSRSGSSLIGRTPCRRSGGSPDR